MSTERRILHHYLKGCLSWSTHTLVGNVRHAIHLIDVAQAEDLRAFQAGLNQILPVLEKLHASLPKYAALTDKELMQNA